MTAHVLVHPTMLERRPLFQLLEWAERCDLVLLTVRAVSGRDILILEHIDDAKVVPSFARSAQYRVASPAGADGGPDAA
jgi:hypothetical protein